MEDNEEFVTNSPKLLGINDSSSSLDLNLLSPLSKSRYGRTRKPKITEDFYNIDVIFEAAQKEFKRSPRSQQLVKSAKSKTLSPKKPMLATIKPEFKKHHNFQHITGDDLLSPPEPIRELSHCKELNPKAIHNFFKIESGMSILQNATVNNDESKSKILSNNLNNLEQVDVTQVLKIISAKSVDENIPIETKVTTKPVLKTYTNKRKSYIKSGVVESFGLPDTPIFPSENFKLAAPKRIKNLDVAPPTSENDINLVDKKLLDTPWKIASMDAGTPDLDVLYDPPSGYNKQSSLKLLNHSVSICDDNIELETVTHTQYSNNNTLRTDTHTLKHPPSSSIKLSPHLSENTSEIEALPGDNTDHVNETNAIVPESNNLFPKLKKIVQNKLRNTFLKEEKKDNNSIPNEFIKAKTNSMPNEFKKAKSKKLTKKVANVIEMDVKENEENDSATIQAMLQNKFQQEIKISKEITKQSLDKSAPITTSQDSQNSKLPEKKLILELNNSEICIEQEVVNNTVSVNKNERLSLKKDLEDDICNLKPEEVTPPVTSPIKLITKKRKRSKSPEKSRKEKVSDTEKRNEIFIPRRGRSSKLLQLEQITETVGPTLRKRLSKSTANAPENAKPTSKVLQLEPTTEIVGPTIRKRVSKPAADALENAKPIVKEIKQEENSDEDLSVAQIKVEVDSDGSVEYVPNTQSHRVPGWKKKKRTVRLTFFKNPISGEGEIMSDGVEIKLDPDLINVGDLLWAKIGGHPFWPCIIMPEPSTNEFKKKICSKITHHFYYHIRFFGDRGRRSWVHSLSVFPFTSKFDLKNQFEQSKDKANFIVKPSALAKWKIAVKEAELQLNCTVDQRLQFFNEILSLKFKKSNEETIDLKMLEVKKELLSDCNNETAAEEEPKLRSTVADKKIKRNRREKSEETGNVIEKKGRAKILGNVLLSEKKNKKGRKNLIEETPSDGATPSESGSESTETFAKSSWKSFNVDDRLLDANSEYSLSDTDSVSKSSSSTPIPNSFQEQVARHRRNNLFRGVNRDHVCQVCQMPKNVFKCKGTCNGKYHYACALLEPKKDEEGVPDSTQTNDQGVDTDTTKETEALSLAEQIDIKMKEVMENIQNDTKYADSTTDYSSSEESNCNQTAEKTGDVCNDSLLIRHVTADHVSFINDSSDDLVSVTTKNEKEDNKESEPINKDFQCRYCLNAIEPPCFACGKDVSNRNESLRQKCSLRVCGKYYHPKCLKLWPQTQWSFSTEKHKDSEELLDTFVCPLHVCHTCASDDPHTSVSRCDSTKVAKCLRCPATYHTTNYCIPAGTQILSISQIICPRHFIQDGYKKTRAKVVRTVNTPWCFICSKGGDLICCETCPTSVHTECLTLNFLEDDTFICEDCETGRFPLYDEIVWVKLGSYRWWPAIILFPNEIPTNVKIIPHNSGEFVVKFFGTHDHYWVGRGRVFLFQEGDKGHCSPSKKRVDTLFKKSIEEATYAHNIKKIFRKNKEAEMKSIVKPPPYIKVRVNRPVGNARQFDGNVSNTTSCECNPSQENPCGPDSVCINRLLLTECDPNVCPAKEKCNNQRFEKRQYPPLTPYKTQGRGWGLKTLASIDKGDFVIEYVGEIIDDQEYQRRIRKMHEQKDQNYYFLTIDKDRIIDAGPKGNLARFMNHCCQPNCETQKWTVNGDTRVGLFAIVDIPADSELTFNYNLECIGKEKKICKCGAPNCSGFIGVKVKDESQKKVKKSSSTKKKKSLAPEVLKNEGPCFICGKNGEVGSCHNKICTKFYHLECVNLESWPEGKWVCPWHNCNVCTKRTIRCCVKCTNSYCPVHSEGNVRYDKLLGFVCFEHDSTKEAQQPEQITRKVSKFKCTNVTEETDVTSTTCDEIDHVPTSSRVGTVSIPFVDLKKSFTSTPIKKSNVSKSLKELKDNLVRENLEIPESSVKRKKQREKKGRSPKKLKPSKSATKPISRFSPRNLIDVTSQNEVKLCASVPIRHLRTRSDTTKIANKRFLGQQSELEKDLPIRKRSRPRCEVTN
ncbi:hypothetical protein FQR65_LT08074 [Abscondita terminalis]|nr:hypothetical protein FQR65_LT08074 [Abscondita terminalis]